MGMKRVAWGAFTIASITGCSGSSEPPPSATEQPLTYYHDIAPIFEQRCMQCHQESGIGPFRLDEYASAKAHAAEIRTATQARVMPPWGVTSDGTCGQFSDSLALSDAELSTIAAWVDAGAQPGAVAPITVPAVPAIENATELTTPAFSPVIQGGELAAFDEYRCFLMDSPGDGFITGYQVLPGTAAIVHHVLGFIVAPDAPSEIPDKTNAQLMQDLDSASPDRIGWPCFGMAGDNVKVRAVPVTWGPGQGVVSYPGESGVALKRTDKIVVQVHYNLADAANAGKSDQTKIQLRIADDVKNVGLFALIDPLLGSLHDEHPTTLAAGQASVKYTWSVDGAHLDFAGVPGLQLRGVGPHMHQRGHKYTMTLGDGTSPAACGVNVPQWDFHWQRLYFYTQPQTFGPTSQVSVTCDYDTSLDLAPVLPGWGTRNEMCLATLYFTAPR